MTDREQRIQDLMEEISCEREQAEIRMLDDDLWLLHPSMRMWFAGEEAVEEWEEAAGFVRGLTEGFANYWFLNEATRQLIWDLEQRAEEALRRARERAREERGEA